MKSKEPRKLLASAAPSLIQDQLFFEEVLSFTDFAANLARASFNPAFGFHTAIADQPASLFLEVTFNLSCTATRPISCARFHNK